LLHVVDADPAREADDVVNEIRTIERELEQYSEPLRQLPRWLVLNKLDLLPDEERRQRVEHLEQALGWAGPAYGISALSGQGTATLARDAMRFLEALREEESADEGPDETADPAA